MTRYWVLILATIFGLLATFAIASRETAQAQKNIGVTFESPVVFQAAGPDAASIQSTVDAFRNALGNPNNGNGGPQPTGRREINWDGAVPGTDGTTAPVTPFNVFLNTRGAQFTTPGIGLSQAPPSGGPQGGLAVLFNNVNYENTFKTFSALRLFTPVGSNVTNAFFFQPGSNGAIPATVSGFGVVFTDVDRPDGTSPEASTLIEYFGLNGELVFSSYIAASPGDGNLSFIGVKFPDARITSVRITTGNSAGGPNDDGKHDIVMMDDFLYAEPKGFPGGF